MVKLLHWPSCGDVLAIEPHLIPLPWTVVLLVKNRFSDPTKEQVGQDWQRKDIINDHQGKALKEGCFHNPFLMLSPHPIDRYIASLHQPVEAPRDHVAHM